VFLAIVILIASFYFSQSFFSGRKNLATAPTSKIVSTGNAPKFAETSVGSVLLNVNVTKLVTDDISAEFYTKLSELDTQKREDLFAQIKAGNTEGLSLGTIDPQKISEKLTPDAIGIRTEIPDSEIQVNSGTDLETYRKRYLLAMTDVELFISEKNAVDVLNSFMNKGDTSGLDALIGAHQNAYTALREISVPITAKEFHKKSLLYFSNSVAVYSALRQYTTDPLKGYIAAQYIGSLASLWGEIYQGISS